MCIDFDWPRLRQWCIAYLRLFIEHADSLDSRQGWQTYSNAKSLLDSPSWKEVKRIADPQARDIVERVIYGIDEGADKKQAIPVMFAETVEAASQWIKLLATAETPSSIYHEVVKIDDAIG